MAHHRSANKRTMVPNGVIRVVPWSMVLWQVSACGILRIMAASNCESISATVRACYGWFLQLKFTQFWQNHLFSQNISSYERICNFSYYDNEIPFPHIWTWHSGSSGILYKAAQAPWNWHIHSRRLFPYFLSCYDFRLATNCHYYLFLCHTMVSFR